MAFVLDHLAEMYGTPAWQPRPRPDVRAGADDPQPAHERRERRARLRRVATALPDVGPGGGRPTRRTWRAPSAAAAWPSRRPRPDPGGPDRHPRSARRLRPRLPGHVAGAGGAGLADPHPGHRAQDGVGRAALLLRPAADAHRPPCRAGQPADRPDPAGGGRRAQATTMCCGTSPRHASTRRTSTSSPTGAARATRAIRPASRCLVAPRCRYVDPTAPRDRGPGQPGSMTMSELTTLTDAFLDEEFEANPVAASGLGLTDYDDRLDDLSAGAFDGRATPPRCGGWRASTTWRRPTSRRPRRSTATSSGRSSAGGVILADFADWRRDPLTYTNPIANGLFGLFLHRLRPEPELVDGGGRAPGAGARGPGGRAGEPRGDAGAPADRAPRPGLRPGPARYVRDLLPGEVGRPGRPRAAWPKRGETAGRGPGRRSPTSWTTWPAAPPGPGSWARSATRACCASAKRSPYDARACATAARRSTTGSPPRCATSPPARPAPPTGGRAGRGQRGPPADRRGHAPALRRLDGARAGLPGRHAAWSRCPTGERCLVEPSPVFQRPVLGVASYSSPPAFSTSLLGHFFVPFAPDGTSDRRDPAAARAQQRRRASPPPPSTRRIPATTGTSSCASRTPAGLRRVYGTPYFTEGWALYAERVMREQRLLRPSPSRSSSTSTPPSSGPPGSWSTRASTWAR